MNFPWKDEWIAEDKLFHFTGSFTAAAVLMRIAWWLPLELFSRGAIRPNAFWWLVRHRGVVVCALVFLAGIGLEWYQYSHGIDYFSWKDIIWNTAGIAAAWGVMR